MSRGSARRSRTLRGSIDFRSGDMLDAALGEFDHAIAMDSLIHYELGDAVAALTGAGTARTHELVWTFAPRTPLLATMHAAGKLFPRGDRAPRIVPMPEAGLRSTLGATALPAWQVGRTQRM
jgi:magnesium-protoporphyrin O-methyltransferase